MINEIIESIKRGSIYVENNISTFLLDKSNAVFFIPDGDDVCLNYVNGNMDYIKREKKIDNVLYLLPVLFSNNEIGSNRSIYLNPQEVTDLWQLSVQSSIAENFFLLSFDRIPGREYPPIMSNEKVIMNGVLGITLREK